MNNYRKGARNEHRSMRVLEAAGYLCIRSAGSHGPFDVVGIGRGGVVLVQCKSGYDPSPAELETLRGIAVPDGTVKLVHRWEHRAKMPLVREVK